MNTVIVDRALAGQLEAFNAEVKLCDEAGRTLGFFVPSPESLRQDYAWARNAFPDEEIEQARREPDGRTTAEVLARLRSL
jgi:hypothetical protein